MIAFDRTRYRVALAEANLTTNDLADRAGVSRQTAQLASRGLLVPEETRAALAAVLGVAVDELWAPCVPVTAVEGDGR